MIAAVEKPQVIARTVFGIGVCVPEDWTDTQILEFVEADSPCGTVGGWHIKRDCPAHKNFIDCEDRPGFVHVAVSI